jgi:Tfp pilus assembly protein PilP
MKLTIGILVMGMAVGTALGQNTDAIDNTRDTMKALQQKQVMDQNAAMGISQTQPASPASHSSQSTSPSPYVQKPVSKAAASKPTQAAIVIVRTPVASTAKPATAPKPAVKMTAAKVQVKVGAPKVQAKVSAPKVHAKAHIMAVKAPQAIAVEEKKSPVEAKKEEPPKKMNLTGRRDPFISPVVNRSMVGSGCSTGKRCLAIDQIALKGVVKSDTGMIAVVTNALDKAYFLHENDPVFNGYVVKITGDSIVFKESVQDKLGKPFQREVTKTITTPAV